MKSHIKLFLRLFNLLILSSFVSLGFCQDPKPESERSFGHSKKNKSTDLIENNTGLNQFKSYTNLEKKLIQQGFLDVSKISSDIIIDLGYAKSDNFTGEILYDHLHHAFLHPIAYRKLEIALKELQKHNSNYTFKIFDALRPRSVQHKMWNVVEHTDMEMYVANPFSGSIHNYGLAVDITIYDLFINHELDMGTSIDHLGWESQYRYNEKLAQQNIISAEAMNNRILLRRIMKKAGFYAIDSEWWHFNAQSRSETKRKFRIVE